MSENTATLYAALHAPVKTAHPEQGWSLLTSGVILFDDGGAILPGGDVLAPEEFLLAA